MLQIIPVVKQQMSSVCSQQVLHYIQQLTTSLTRLQQLQSLPHGTASPRYAEFSRFFHRQLDSILQDALAKFEGRKYNFYPFYRSHLYWFIMHLLLADAFTKNCFSNPEQGQLLGDHPPGKSRTWEIWNWSVRSQENVFLAVSCVLLCDKRKISHSPVECQYMYHDWLQIASTFRSQSWYI